MSMFHLQILRALGSHEVDMNRYVRKHARVRYQKNGIEYVLSYGRGDEVRLTMNNSRFANGTPNFFRDDWVRVSDITAFKATLCIGRVCGFDNRPRLSHKEMALIRQFEMIAQVDLDVLPLDIPPGIPFDHIFNPLPPERTISIPPIPLGALARSFSIFGDALEAYGRFIESALRIPAVLRGQPTRFTEWQTHVSEEDANETIARMQNSQIETLSVEYRSNAGGTWESVTESTSESAEGQRPQRERYEVTREDVDVDDVLERIESDLEENDREPLKVGGAITQHKINQFMDGELREMVEADHGYEMQADPDDDDEEWDDTDEDDDEDDNTSELPPIVMFDRDAASRLYFEAARRNIGSGHNLQVELASVPARPAVEGHQYVFEKIVALKRDDDNGYMVTGKEHDQLIILADGSPADRAAAIIKKWVSIMSSDMPYGITEITETITMRVPMGDAPMTTEGINHYWVRPDGVYIDIDYDNDDTPIHDMKVVVPSAIFSHLMSHHHWKARYNPANPVCDHDDVHERTPRFNGVRRAMNVCRRCGIMGMESPGFNRTFVDFDMYVRWKSQSDMFPGEGQWVGSIQE